MSSSENKQLTKEDYNRVPVYYCKQCGSLKVMAGPQGIIGDYCDECGSTDVGKASIDGWLVLKSTVFKPLYRERPVYKYDPFKNY